MIDAVLDTREARRTLARIERAIGTAEKRALKLAGGNVRKAYVSGLRRGNTKALPAKVPPLNAAWRNLLHPRSRMGGKLADGKVWTIVQVGHGVVVDIVQRLRPLLERWQFVGGDRPAQLRTRVSAWQTIPEQRRKYHVAARYHNWPQNPDTLPEVVSQPPRNVVSPVREWANRNFGDWYTSIFAKLSNGAIRRFSSRTA